MSHVIALCHWLVLGLLLSEAVVTTGSSEASSTRSPLCRSREKMLSRAAFEYDSCALCYVYMPRNQFPTGAKWRTFKNLDAPVDGYIVPWLSNGTHQTLADPDTNSTDPALLGLQDSFIGDVSLQLWRDCCQAARDCCDKIQIDETEYVQQTQAFATVTEEATALVSSLGYAPGCPPTWDGWQCWAEGGVAGKTSYEVCPSHIFFETAAAGGQNTGLMQASCGRYAEKKCNSTGYWLARTNGEWTDFTTCSKVRALRTQEYVHVGLYSVSIVALVPAIVIFFSYKVLRVPRIAIHKNLFSSLLLHCFSMILFKSLILLPYIQDQGRTSSALIENTIPCRLLMMISKYFRLTNYTWMFCEGYYLHRLLANTFEEERSLKFILGVGWGLPLIPCVLYGTLRIWVDNSFCWALPAETHSWVEWLYMTPGLLCILANFLFFLNIFRILVTKLQAPHANEPAHFRKAVHATVVLLPLFGLHWLLTLYRPQDGAHCIWKTVYKYLNVFLDGLQGLMVAIAFCYRNGEIRYLLKSSWNRTLDRLFPNRSANGAGGAGSSRLGTHIQMKEFHRRNSETCFTQVHGDTQVGSRESLSMTPPEENRTPIMKPFRQQFADTSPSLEVHRKKNGASKAKRLDNDSDDSRSEDEV